MMCIMATNSSSEILRYDSVYLTCRKKLTSSQLSPPHGTKKKLKCETKNKTMNTIGTVRGLNRDEIVKIARLTGCKNL